MKNSKLTQLIKDKIMTALRYISALVLLFLLIFNNNIYSQTIINTPSVNYFYSDSKISSEPNGGVYVKATAEYYGVAVSYKLYRGEEIVIKNSILESIAKIKSSFPFAKFFVNNNDIFNIEIIDSILLDFVHINPSNYGLNFYCLIKLDSLSEKEAVLNFYSIKAIVQSIAIPQTTDSYQPQFFSRNIMEKPILGFTSLETYNDLVMKRITSEYNNLSSAMMEKQLFEIEISNYIEVTRGSLFYCYFFKKYNFKLASK